MEDQLIEGKLPAQHIVACSLGNILEWFDFGLFIYLAPVIGVHFFPANNIHTSTLIVFVVFAVGFICRPLGGIFLGHLGDRVGRAKTLIWSIVAISSSTLLVGLLPTYQSVGILAPILFILCRLIQGLSVGGEYSGVVIYLAESAPYLRRGFFTSFAAVGSSLGFLLATGMAYINTLISSSAVDTWKWRVPFIVSGLLGVVILTYRIKLLETQPFQVLLNTKPVHRAPLLKALRHVPGKLLQILGLTCMGSTFYYMFFGYLPTYLSQYFKTPLTTALKCQSIILVLMLIFLPLAGWLGDTIGRKKMLFIASSGVMILTIPCFYLVQTPSTFAILIGTAIAGLLSAFEQGSTLTTFVENCPLDVRYSGISFAYNMGNTLFGGTAPLVISLLAGTKNNLAPAFYLIFMAFLTFCVVLTLKNRQGVHVYTTIEDVDPKAQELS